MNIDRKGLETVLADALALTNKVSMTHQEQRRHATLLAMAACLRQGGITLAELEADHDNERRARAGLAPVQPSADNPEVRAFQRFVKGEKEQRDIEGAPMLSHIGTYSGMGFFIPTGYWGSIMETLKAHDVLFDDAFCTQIRTKNGRPLTYPLMDDTENDASPTATDPQSTSSVDIAHPNHAKIGAYSFNSRRWPVSLEAFEDVDSSTNAMELFKRFTSKALARGIGRELLTGSGTNTILGLLPALAALGAPTVVAAGSAVNDGSSATGANSLGTPDFAAAYAKLDAAYLASPTCAWLMNIKTFGALLGIVDKVGQPVISFVGGAPTILGKPVKISPSMPDIAAAANSVLLGDLSYWCTRLVVSGADDIGIQVFREAPGLIEQGLVAFRSFVRADGALLWSGDGPSPFVILQQHS
ncbi:MAG TPA: phage major capsid protein [Candidatus Acidoferrum sp.]|nr:phage major capsid protein [Candidatus Acidoferrum sp.]